MNYTIIILGVLLIVILFAVYMFMYSSSSVLTKQADLNISNSTIPIKTSPTTTRYAYGIWIYVNTWSTNKEKVIFSRQLSDAAGAPGLTDIKLYIEATTPSLKFMINNNDKPILVTDNFPVQKWVNIVVNVDNKFVDFYLDGKLVKSVKLETQPSSPSATTAMSLGSGFDAAAAGFTRWANPVNPQDVWSNYLQGNGGMLSNLAPTASLQLFYTGSDNTQTQLI